MYGRGVVWHGSCIVIRWQLVGGLFPVSTICVLGIELKLSGLAAKAFTHRDNSLAQLCVYIYLCVKSMLLCECVCVVYVSVYAHLCCMPFCDYTHLCQCVSRPEVDNGNGSIFIQHYPHCLRQGISLILKLTILSRLTGQQVSGVFLSLRTQCCTYRPCHYVVEGIWTKFLMFTWQVLYLLSHLPVFFLWYFIIN